MRSVEVATSPRLDFLVIVTNRHRLYVRRPRIVLVARSRRIRETMNADGAMENIRNALERSEVALNELGDGWDYHHGSCRIARQIRVFRQC